MEQTISQSNPNSSELGMEDLFKAAFFRTKERFLTYFLTYILSICIFIGVFLAIGLLVGLNILIWTTSQSVTVGVVTIFVSSLIALGLLIYVGCWTSLAALYSLVSPTKLGVFDVFKSVRPLIWSYYKVSIVTTLFIIGLWPFGLLSIGIILILWAVWGMFMIFVFLEKKESGLKNLFISKAIVSTKFWGILLRVLMIYAVYVGIIFLLGASQGNEEARGVSAILMPILGLFAGPFITSYFFEIYKRLPQPKKIPSNKVWVVLSVIGWVLSIALLATSLSGIVEGARDVLEDRDFQKGIQMIEDNPQDFMNEGESAELNQLFKEIESELESEVKREL